SSNRRRQSCGGKPSYRKGSKRPASLERAVQPEQAPRRLEPVWAHPGLRLALVPALQGRAPGLPQQEPEQSAPVPAAVELLQASPQASSSLEPVLEPAREPAVLDSRELRQERWKLLTTGV